MSALGQKRTLGYLQAMSALPPKADIRQHNYDVRFVPKADSASPRRHQAVSHLHRPPGFACRWRSGLHQHCHRLPKVTG